MHIPAQLTDTQLVEALERCARDERRSTADLVAHLAEMDARQIHLREGFGSLFAYCCEVLRLSESATYKRIEVARLARRHPIILERLCDGALSLTTALLLSPHLTLENRDELLAAAAAKGKRAVEEWLARRFPRPDVPALVRKVAVRGSIEPGALSPSMVGGAAPPPQEASTAVYRPAARVRPLALPLSADRYQIRFTASTSTWEKLRVARELLRHAVPSGDPGEIVDRALTALIEELARKKCASIKGPAARQRPTGPASRHVPAKVRRAVWVRDQGRCAFVGRGRRRCGEQGFLEFHHVRPYAVGGAATVANIQLRCRAHNALESVLFFGQDRQGPERAGTTRPGASSYRGLSRNSRLLHVTPASALTNSDRSSGSTANP